MGINSAAASIDLNQFEIKILNEDSSTEEIINEISRGNTSFYLPGSKADSDVYLQLFKKLVSQPLSKKLVLELAKSGKDLILKNGENNQFDFMRSYSKHLKQNVIFSRAISIDLHRRSEMMEWAVLVKRDWAYFSNQAPLSLEFSPKYISFAHELIHAYHSLDNELKAIDLPPSVQEYTNLEEENTIKGVPGIKSYTENEIRAQFGLRDRYLHIALAAKPDPFRGTGKLVVA